MANSKYEYVKLFEQNDVLLPHTWIVIRLDGRGFTRFSQAHDFEKPNDERALLLMNECAKVVLADIPDIVFGYGVSDEYSFVLRKNSSMYQRRASKLISVIVSLFTATYVMKWVRFFPRRDLLYAPSFDGRAICYPSDEILRDYLAWRQVDCHVNNQYNTCYWNLIKSGSSAASAQSLIKVRCSRHSCLSNGSSEKCRLEEMQDPPDSQEAPNPLVQLHGDGTLADFKNELLHTRFQINYNELPPIFRKGSLVFRRKEQVVVKTENGVPVKRERSNIVVVHEDMIKDTFWNVNPSILGTRASKRLNAKSEPSKGQNCGSPKNEDDN